MRSTVARERLPLGRGIYVQHGRAVEALPLLERAVELTSSRGEFASRLGLRGFAVRGDLAEEVKGPGLVSSLLGKPTLRLAMRAEWPRMRGHHALVDPTTVRAG